MVCLVLDYLVVGHVTRDLLPGGGFTIGGTVTYASRTASALGCRVAVVTSAAADLDLSAPLSGVELIRRPAEATTTFENIYTPAGRQQFLHAVATPLDLDAVPQRWRRPDIVHLAPLVNECDPALSDAFPGALVGVTPQGWMRAWDHAGRVYGCDWLGAAEWLPRIDAAVISQHDVGGDEAAIAHLAHLAPVLVVTLGPRGCRVYVDGKAHQVPVTPAPEIDPTGAGDVFAAAFFVRLRQCGDPWAAAQFANRVAALSVGRAGWAGTPTPEEITNVMHEV
jgi:sugar/nucleoside kinase (ribokinase family)